MTSGKGNTCKETPLAFLTNHHPILQGWKWREKLQVCGHGWKLGPKDLTFSPEISCYSWQPPWWSKGFLFPFVKPPSKGVIDFLFSVPKCIWATRGGHLPRRKIFLYALLGTQSWLIYLRLSHLGHSLVDNTGYLLSVTAYNVNLGKGNDQLAETGFALEQLVKWLWNEPGSPKMPVTVLGSLPTYDGNWAKERIYCPCIRMMTCFKWLALVQHLST